MKLSQREKILIGLLLILGVIYACYNFAYKPGKIAREQLQQENRVLKSLIKRGENAKTQNTGIVQERTGIAKLGNKLMIQVPTRAQVPETMAFLKKTASESHVSLKSLNYTAPQASKDNHSSGSQKTGEELAKVQVLDYNITVQGSYNNLLAFLLKIENAPRLYIISNCSMTAAAKKIDEKAVSEDLQSNPEAEPGAEPVPLPSVPKGSAVYDGSNIKLNLKFAAYCDEEPIPEFKIKEVEVPIAAGRTNPFL